MMFKIKKSEIGVQKTIEHARHNMYQREKLKPNLPAKSQTKQLKVHAKHNVSNNT
jgi:hypothetical protein